MFHAEGTFTVTIRKAVVAEPKFAPPPAVDVCLYVEDADGNGDWWRGEVSSRMGRGNFADRNQAQITFETLTGLGLQGGDLSKLEALVGRQTTATVVASEKDGKVYYNLRYLGGASDAPQPLDPAALQSRIAAIFGAAPVQAPAPAAQQWPTQPAAPAGGNPFGAAAAPRAANPFQR